MSNVITHGTVKIRSSPRARIYNCYDLYNLLDILKHIKILRITISRIKTNIEIVFKGNSIDYIVQVAT